MEESKTSGRHSEMTFGLQPIHSDFGGFTQLIELHSNAKDLAFDEIEIDMRQAIELFDCGPRDRDARKHQKKGNLEFAT